MRLLICAGGTGGGVYPALTVLQSLQAAGIKSGAVVSPAVSELQTLWVGGIGGMEAELVSRAGVPFRAIPAAGVHGVGLKTLPGNIWQLARGFRSARRLLREFRPEVLFFTGGYLAVPVALAGRLPAGGFPRPAQLLYVPDIEPGLALKTLARFADKVAITVEQTRKFVAPLIPREGSITVTGYPVREELREWTRQSAQAALHLDPGLPSLLVMGGSKGARSINRALMASLPQILAKMQVVHISGQLDWPEVEAAGKNLPADLQSRYHAFAFLHAEIGAALAAADLAVARAGASTLGEFPLFGLPAVLVPYPYAWRYQRVNADYLAKQGAAVVLEDAELSQKLAGQVLELMGSQYRREAMRAAMAALAKPGSAGEIARLLVNLAAGQGRN